MANGRLYGFNYFTWIHIYFPGRFSFGNTYSKLSGFVLNTYFLQSITEVIKYFIRKGIKNNGIWR